MSPAPDIPDEAAAFIERFADALVVAGMPRMAARVFGAVLSSDDGRATAAALGSALRASPAAISGAVRYLEQVSLLRRSREPGQRRDHYVLGDDVWYQAITQREDMLVEWERTMAVGAAALGGNSPAGRRMSETQEFFAFLREELPVVMQRWESRRDELRAAASTVGAVGSTA